MPTLYKLFRKWAHLFKQECEKYDVHPQDLENAFVEIGLVYTALSGSSNRDFVHICGVLVSTTPDYYPEENESKLRELLQDHHFGQLVLPDIVIEFETSEGILRQKRAKVV